MVLSICIDRSLTRKRSLYYLDFEKRIVGLTDELRGKYELRGQEDSISRKGYRNIKKANHLSFYTQFRNKGKIHIEQEREKIFLL